jgi:alkaline ceramidase
MFNYQSSQLDWCEPNYTHSKYIAEYWNTCSNIIFIVLGINGLKFCRDKKLPSIYRLLFLVYIFTGLSSMWFHATLSLIGQLFDEIGICLGTSICLLNHYKINIIYAILIVPLIFIDPAINAYALLCGGCFIPYILYKKSIHLKKIHQTLIKILMGLFAMSVLFWIFDKMCFQIESKPLHSHYLWHILIGITIYLTIILWNHIENENTIDSTIIDSTIIESTIIELPIIV